MLVVLKGYREIKTCFYEQQLGQRQGPPAVLSTSSVLPRNIDDGIRRAVDALMGKPMTQARCDGSNRNPFSIKGRSCDPRTSGVV